MERLVGLTAESLSEEIEFMGTKRLEWVVMWMISKIIHHERQIAAILGAWKRLRGD